MPVPASAPAGHGLVATLVNTGVCLILAIENRAAGSDSDKPLVARVRTKALPALLLSGLRAHAVEILTIENRR